MQFAPSALPSNATGRSAKLISWDTWIRREQLHNKCMERLTVPSSNTQYTSHLHKHGMPTRGYYLIT